MNLVAVLFTALSACALAALPARLAPLPLLAAACYMTLGQGVELGPFTFTVIRLLIAVGAVRIVIRREASAVFPLNRLDWALLAWGCWACLSSAFHDSPSAALVYRLGLVYNAWGIYFLLRSLCTTSDDAIMLCRVIVAVLTVVAAAMLYEHAALHNPFAAFGGVDAVPMIREGRVRATGPFAHPILAGTVGGTCVPIALALWPVRRFQALIGCAACTAIVIASGSSGPVLTAVVSLGAILLWPLRNHTRTFRWAFIFLVATLAVAMKAPVYYLIARIDIVGGSTGWHRARLIESAVEHIDEWWLVGTDVTRHWMTEGVANDPTQVDITNHYLRMGVWGGLPLLTLFVWMLRTAFGSVGAIVDSAERSPASRFLVWAMGCSLLGHAVSFISVSYFDQSVAFLYITLAIIGGAIANEPVTAAQALVNRKPLQEVYGKDGRFRTSAVRNEHRRTPAMLPPRR